MKQITSAHFFYGRGEVETSTWDGEKEGNLPSWVKIQVNLMDQTPLVFLIPIHTAEGIDAAVQ